MRIRFYRIKIGSVFDSAIQSETLATIQRKVGIKYDSIPYYRGPPDQYDGKYEEWKAYCLSVGDKIVAEEWPLWEEIEVTVSSSTFFDLCCEMLKEDGKIHRGLISLVEIIDEENSL